MKKSLSLLLSGAMVFGLFASAVSAAESTELTTQQKYEALKTKGIFAGLGDGSAGLDQEMTRAQAARIIALLKGLEGIGDPDTRVVTEKPFPDVDLGKWYTEEVDAVKADKSFVGNADGNFYPNGQLTVQELAVAVAQALGFDATNAEPVEIEGAASWAGPSIKFLQDNGYNVPTNYTANALRGQLVDATYVADSILNPAVPAKVSVVSAKQMNGKSVEVKLDKAVDTKKATLSVKRGTATVGSSTEWAEDGKSAVVKLDGNIAEDKYTVTLAGIEESEIKTASVEFAGQIEKIVKIDILTASETLPMAQGVRIDFQATNQFGSKSDLSASNFSINTAGVGGPVNVSGEQAFTLNLEGVAKDTRIPVTIIHTSSGISTNKVFIVGEAPIASKVEIGDIIYANNKTRVEANDTIGLKITVLDQYGIRLNIENVPAAGPVLIAYGLNSPRGITPITSDPSTLEKDATPFADLDGDGYLDLVLNAKTPTYTNQDRDVTVTIYATGSNQSASKVVTVVQPKQPATVEFGDTNLQLAEGDGNKYVPLILKDKEGNALSADDIVAAEKSGKLTIYSTNGNVVLGLAAPGGTNDNGSTAVIQRTGDNKGKIRIDAVNGKGSGQIVVMIAGSAPVQQAAWPFTVSDARVPTSIKVSTPAAPKMIHGDATNKTDNEVKYKVYDQYGAELDKNFSAAYVVKFELKGIGNSTPGTIVSIVGVTADDATEYDIQTSVFDDSIKFRSAATNSNTGTVELVAKLMDIRGATPVEISRAAARTQVITGNESGLGLTHTIAVDGAKDNTLYAIGKGKVTTTADVYGDATLADVTIGTMADLAALPQAKGFKVTATDASGNKVALPDNRIVSGSVMIANPNVAKTDSDKLVGWDAGTTQVTVAFRTPTGTLTDTKDITVKKDALAVDAISAKKSSKSVANALLATIDPWDANLFEEIKVTDQYGTSYTNAQLAQFKFGVAYYIHDIKRITYPAAPAAGSDAGLDTIEVTAANKIEYTLVGLKDIKSFVLDAVAPNGKKVTITVEVD